MYDDEEVVVATPKKIKKISIKEYPVTDFSEQPVKGNPKNIEVGDSVVLARSMKVLDTTGALWLAGVKVRVTEIHPQESGLIVAKITRTDGTTSLVYVCWLEKE